MDELAALDILRLGFDQDGVMRFNNKITGDKFYTYMKDLGYSLSEIELTDEVIFYDSALDDITLENLQDYIVFTMDLYDKKIDRLLEDRKILKDLYKRLP